MSRSVIVHTALFSYLTCLQKLLIGSVKMVKKQNKTKQKVELVIQQVAGKL